jgi:CubicO group peptidase (beta-lactamase class C family)
MRPWLYHIIVRGSGNPPTLIFSKTCFPLQLQRHSLSPPSGPIPAITLGSVAPIIDPTLLRFQAGVQSEAYMGQTMTKPVTVAALMQFWDQGRFELRDPVSKYIPEFKDLQVAEMDANGQIRLVPAKRQVTIHDLLSFTGGISATYMAALGPVHKYVAEEYAKAGVQDLMSETYTKNLEENVKALTKCPLIFQPGESWCYYQGGMDTIAYLVEIFSGKPFDKYLEEHIFTPLKIKEMWFYPPEDKFSRIPAIMLRVDLTLRKKGGFVCLSGISRIAIDSDRLSRI